MGPGSMIGGPLATGMASANLFTVKCAREAGAESMEDEQEDVTLKATVDIISRGGLIVSAGGVRGFIPASHVRTTEAAGEEGVQVGTVLPVKFLELDQAQERCLFSHRRALSDSQLKSFKVGDVA